MTAGRRRRSGRGKLAGRRALNAFLFLLSLYLAMSWVQRSRYVKSAIASPDTPGRAEAPLF